jgi:hypothetical protein
VRITVNLMKPTLQQMVAIMTAEKPMLAAAPASQDTNDKNRADVATQVLRKAQLPTWLNFALIDRLQKRWKAVTGTSCVLPEWNPEGGVFRKKVVPGKDGKPVVALDDDGEEIYEPEGDLDLLFFTSFEIYPDPSCTSEKDAEYVFLVSSMDPDEAERRYGVKKKGTTGTEKGEGTGGPSRVSSLLARVFSMFGPNGGYLTQWGAVSNRGVDVLRLFIAPNLSEPEGRKILMVGDKVVHDDSSEMAGEFRFDPVFYRHEENGKRFFGNGVMELVVDLQIELNSAISQMAQQRRLNLNPKMLVPDTCNVQDEDWLSSEGSIMRYGSMGGEKPEPLKIPGIEPALFQTIQVYQDMFDRIIGLSEPSRGEPVSRISGKSIQLLQEANRSRLGVVGTSDFERWADVAERILYLAGKHFTPDRLRTVAGDNYASMEDDFFSESLHDPVDVIVENDNALPQDRAGRLSLISQLAASGGPLTLEEPLRTEVFKMLKYQDVQGILEEENLDEMRMRRLYKAIVATEQAQMPGVYDNPVKCRAALEVMMKAEDFERLGQENPAAAAAVVQLYLAYGQMLAGVPLPGPGGAPMPPGVIPPQDMVNPALKAAATPEPKGSPPAPQGPPQ